jgi:SepF-like predicted cell division protein (DUF552 family)
MKIAFTFSWLLRDGDIAQVRDIIAKLRQNAIDLGGDVGDLIVQTGDEAQAMFTATLPGASVGNYGLASAGNSSWSWSGAVVISDVRNISELNAAAAELGLEVAETYAGMVFTTKKNADGVVQSEQRWAFDWSNF